MKSKILLIVVSLLMATAMSAQSKKISGTVIDSNGDPVLGASVMIPGSTTGTIAEIDGSFTLDVPVGSKLEVSSIGYASSSFVVDERSDYKIVLSEDIEMIDKVVVVGYGTTKRENFTGSVSTYKVGEGPVSNTNKSNAMDLLRGRAAGVSMSQSGEVGSSPSIQIRGQKSINGGSAPLIVLDGVIYKGSIMDIDPNTIETMSVMKDATSLAAYGSQAANGVIMIASKKGLKGKPIISFKGQIGLSEQNYNPKMRDGYGYIDIYNARMGLASDDVSWMSDIELSNYKAGKQTDWVKYISQTGVQQEYSLNVSGAGDNINYMFGTSYMDNVGFIKGNEYIRENFTGRIGADINKYISVGVNFSYSESHNDGVRPDYDKVRNTPWGSPTLSDGVTMRKYVDGKEESTVNPLWDTYNGKDYELRVMGTNIGGEINVKIPWVKGLSYKITGNYTTRAVTTRQFTHETNYVNMSLGEDAYTTEAYNAYLGSATGSIAHTQNVSWVLDNILTYTREVGDHYLNATLVYTRDSEKVEGDEMTGSDFSALGNTTLGFHGLGNASVQKISDISYTLHNDVGYLGRLNYSYKNKYHFNASVRRDGSSVFGTDHKWGVFPAFGGAWTMSDEPFMKGLSSWLDYLKVKLSWGKNGNQSLSPYGTLSKMSVGQSGGNTYYFNNEPHYGQQLSTLGNPDLGWETTTSWNGGFEADFLGRRLHWEVDAYKSKTSDQIFSRTIPVMGAGISSQSATMGRVDNWGIESTINAQIINKGDFGWNSTLTYTINRNKLVELYGGNNEEDDITNNLFIGKSLGAIYGYNSVGIVQETDTDYMTKNGALPGDAMFEDLDNDGYITASDRKVLGYEKENFRMSMSHTFTYKDLSLYLMFYGVFSGNGYGMAVNQYAYQSNDNMQYTNKLDHPYWTTENKSDTYPSASYNDSRYTPLQSYGYVRLQDASLSYNLKAKFLNKANISSLQFFASGHNLFFIAPGWDFSDPDVRNYQSQQLARTYTFGVNVRF